MLPLHFLTVHKLRYTLTMVIFHGYEESREMHMKVKTRRIGSVNCNTINESMSAHIHTNLRAHMFVDQNYALHIFDAGEDIISGCLFGAAGRMH